MEYSWQIGEYQLELHKVCPRFNSIPKKWKNMNNSTDTQIMEGDCFERLLTLPAESFAACITDPPYNYEFIGHKWNSSESKRRMEAVSKESGSSTLVKNIPYGSGLAGGVRNERWYRRNKENIEDYRDWTEASLQSPQTGRLYSRVQQH